MHRTIQVALSLSLFLAARTALSGCVKNTDCEEGYICFDGKCTEAKPQLTAKEPDEAAAADPTPEPPPTEAPPPAQPAADSAVDEGQPASPKQGDNSTYFAKRRQSANLGTALFAVGAVSNYIGLVLQIMGKTKNNDSIYLIGFATSTAAVAPEPAGLLVSGIAATRAGNASDPRGAVQLGFLCSQYALGGGQVCRGVCPL